MNKAQLYIITAPSGAGKTSLIKALLEKDPNIALSISHTTRPPRVGEQSGHDYHFVDEVRFKAMIGESGFLEYAEVFGNYYGTSREAIDSQMRDGHDVILEIDVQGATQVRALLPECRWVFILPPSRDVLRNRLVQRGLDSQEVIARRTAEAQHEMQQVGQADYVIINEDFARALSQLHGVFQTERLRTERQRAQHPSTFDNLLKG